MKKLFISIMIMVFCGMTITSMAYAYDEAACKKDVAKMKKHIKSYKSFKFKEMFDKIDDMDEEQGGIDVKDLEASIANCPFKDLKWVKKFVKYLDNIKEHCTK